MQSDFLYRAYAPACGRQLADLNDSVHNPERQARIYSEYDDVVRDNGVPKSARVVLDENDPDNFLLARVEIAMDRWDNSSVTDKLVTAAIEMAILAGAQTRYMVGDLFFQSETFKRAHQQLAYIDRKDPHICVIDSVSKTMLGAIDFHTAHDPHTYRRVYDNAEVKILRNVSMKLPTSGGELVDETAVEVLVIVNRRNAAMLESPIDAQPGEIIRYPGKMESLCKK
jgi:hypothetical protein